jgi:hypothetical protein
MTATIHRVVMDWLDGLDDRERALATFPFDDPERFTWDYRPGDRAGLALGQMSGRQRADAVAVLATALSSRGHREIQAIIDLEPVLGAIERARGVRNWDRRDPARYWFAVFGDPGAGGPWSWRIGGHHVAIGQTFVGDRFMGSAPSFLGANPATVPSGSSAGRRAIDGEETLSRALLASLAEAQAAIAVTDENAPPDILSGNGPRARLDGVPEGIRYDQLDASQQEALRALIRHYLTRARDELSIVEWARIESAGLDDVTFAWAGSAEPGRGHYYAVRGPAFLVEYDNTQDGANHIHAVWRDLENDWGEDLLARHYAAEHP